MHGFALNVCPELIGFERIVPCGIAEKPVGSLAQFLPRIRVEDVRQLVAAQFAAVFDVEFIEVNQTQILPSVILNPPEPSPHSSSG
jgi:lipoyl(octanoyl) transferase